MFKFNSNPHSEEITKNILYYIKVARMKERKNVKM